MTTEHERKLAEWADELRPFIPLTIDQLRTYVAVHETRSTRSAALHVLKRDQSSVEKQLKTLDEHFWNFNKERLIIKAPGRGGELRFTRGGERVYELALHVLQEFRNTRTHLEKVYRLRIALTKFTISLLAEIEQPIAKKFKQHGRKPERELIHVRSERTQQCLDDPTIDFALGPIIKGQEVNSNLEFIRWKTESVVLVSNIPFNFAEARLGQFRSLGLPLILPTTGIMLEVVSKALGGPEGLNVVERCNDIQFGFDLLRLKVHEACIIAPEDMAQELLKRTESEGLFHSYPIVDCDLRVDTGLFRRAGEDNLFDPTHPVQIFWDAFKDLAALREKPLKNRAAVIRAAGK